MERFIGMTTEELMEEGFEGSGLYIDDDGEEYDSQEECPEALEVWDAYWAMGESLLVKDGKCVEVW